MSIFHTFPTSRPIIVIPYQDRWPQEYQTIAAELWDILGDSVLRIDHIGSTSVPGLAAKDIIDIQLTVTDLDDPAFKNRLKEAGYVFRGEFFDEFVRIPDENSPEMRKCYAREKEGQRRTHIHIREQGCLNQRYALLFRDYLRASEGTRLAYQLIKQRLAQLFPESIDGYLFIKDPVMDLMFVAAENWAKLTNWQETISD